MQYERFLQVFRQRLLDALPTEISRIILFGSQARGDATPDSDLDLLILVRDKTSSTVERVRQIRYEVMARPPTSRPRARPAGN